MVVGLLLAVALAGPTARQEGAPEPAIVILVSDVSLSMQATDVPPSRIAVAQEPSPAT